MAKVLDYCLKVSEFKLQSHYYIHFQINTLGKVLNPFILPAMGLIILLLSNKDGFGIK